MTPRRGPIAIAAALCAISGGACAPEDPYDRGPNRPSPAHVNDRDLTTPASGELPGEAPAELTEQPTRFPEAQPTPLAALRLAARLYGNWTSATAAHRLERMAAFAAGQARAELTQAAAQTEADTQQPGARARARVEAIEVAGQSSVRRGLVVTRELIQAPELAPQGWRYRVTRATVVHQPEGWVLSQWQPQP